MFVRRFHLNLRMRRTWLVGLLLWWGSVDGAPYFPASASSSVEAQLPPAFPSVISTNSVRWARWSDEPGTRSWTGYAGSEAGSAGRLLSGLGMRLGWGWEGEMLPLMSRSLSGEPWVVGVTDAGIWTMGLKDPMGLVLSRFFESQGDGHWHGEDWLIRPAHGREMVFGWMMGERIFWLERAIGAEGGTGHAHLRSAEHKALDDIQELGVWKGGLPSDPHAFWDLEDYVVWAGVGEDLVWLSKADLSTATASAKTWREELLLMGRESGWIWNQGNTLYRGNDSAAIMLELGGMANDLTFAPLHQSGWMTSREVHIPWMYGGWGLFTCALMVWGWREWQWRSRSTSQVESGPSRAEGGIGWSSPEQERLHERLETLVDGNGLSSIAHWSPALRMILLQEKRFFTTAELDALLGIDDIASPETLRARRSRMIQNVNGEFNLLYGMDLIVREREKEDRRKSLYRIAHLPPALQKYLKRNGFRGGPQGPSSALDPEEGVRYSKVLRDSKAVDLKIEE